MDEPTDEALMHRVRDGDVGELGVLFTRHHARVHALCQRITRRPDVADDLTQETFLRVLRYRASYRGEAAFLTWLYRLAYNVCNDHWRSPSANRERTVGVEALANVAAHAEAEPTHRQAILEAALARLGPDQRAVLVLTRYHDLSYDEVASVLECSPAAARVRAHRALNELREIFRELEQR